jgi:hypothetical protein
MEGDHSKEYKYAVVLNSINAFYSNKVGPISEFDHYLKEFQKSPCAWLVCIQLLRDNAVAVHVDFVIKV